MKIKFTDTRELLTGGIVTAGEERDFPDTEAQAFINNGVAVAVAPATKKTEE